MEGMSSSGSFETTDDEGSLETSGGFDDDTDIDDDGDSCGCDETIPVGFGTVVDGEFSAETALSMLQTPEIPWHWTAFADPLRDTVMTIAISYEGGQVMHGPDGLDGCSWLSVPCQSTLMIPVVVTVTTGDGVLDASFPGTLDVDVDPLFPGMVFREQLSAEELGGTLMARPLADSSSELSSISVHLDWEIDGTSPGIYLGGSTDDGNQSLGQDVG